MAIPEEYTRGHAHVMVGYVAAFFIAVFVQFTAKEKARARFAQKRKTLEAEGIDTKGMRFSRYNSDDPLLIAADRGIGNFVEWAPAFLALFATHVIAAGDCTTVGWIYVFFRACYPVAAVAGGVGIGGAKPAIFICTMPMYTCLIYMAFKILRV